MLQSAGVDPEDPLLAELKSYEVFPKQEAWLDASIADVLARKADDSKS